MRKACKVCSIFVCRQFLYLFQQLFSGILLGMFQYQFQQLLQHLSQLSARFHTGVDLEGGVYLCGTIFLRSNVTLEIAQGTVLKANPDISDYAENTHHNRYRNEEALDRCFLYGEDLENIGIHDRRGNVSAHCQYGYLIV